MTCKDCLHYELCDCAGEFFQAALKKGLGGN